MRIEKVSDLLPIPDSVTKPHAYQVFGLEGGEQDVAKVVTAIQKVYQRLKATKSQADPKVWKRAAGLAEAARKVLTDPELRRDLDAQFGVVGPKAENPAAADPPADHGTDQDDNHALTAEDPLAAVLPSSNPLSGISSDSAANVLGIPPLGNPSASTLGTPPLGAPPATPTPATPAPQASEAQAVSAAMPKPSTASSNSGINVAPVKPVRRRKKKKHGTTLVLGGFVVVLLGSLGYLLYYLNNGNRIRIGEQSIAAAAPGTSAANAPPSPHPKSIRDGVMNSVPASGIAESIRNRDANRPSANRPGQGSGLASSDPIRNPNLGTPSTELPNMSAGMGNSSMDSDDMRNAIDASSANPPANPPANEPGMDSMPADGMDSMRDTKPESTVPSQPSPQQLAENAKQIEAVENLIRSGDWDQMKPAADALEKLPLSAEQRKRSRSLYDIADLASFYRGAIERGLGTLTVGSPGTELEFAL